MRTVERDNFQIPLIKVEDEYYQHRDTLIVAELKHICRNAKTGKVEYHLITEKGEPIEDDLFNLYWDSISAKEYFA